MFWRSVCTAEESWCNKIHLEEKLNKFPVMFAIRVWLLCSYPSPMGHLSFRVWQPEMANELFFFSNFSWGVANYSCSYVLFWWWPCKVVRKRGKKKELRIRTMVVVHWKIGCVLQGSCRCCSWGARGAGEGQSSEEHDCLQHSILLHLVLFGFPCRPSPSELPLCWLSPWEPYRECSENAQRKLSSAVWQQDLSSPTQAWRLCLDVHKPPHLGLPSCRWCLATSVRGSFSQHTSPQLGWGLGSRAPNEELQSEQNCTYPIA